MRVNFPLGLDQKRVEEDSGALGEVASAKFGRVPSETLRESTISLS